MPGTSSRAIDRCMYRLGNKSCQIIFEHWRRHTWFYVEALVRTENQGEAPPAANQFGSYSGHAGSQRIHRYSIVLGGEGAS